MMDDKVKERAKLLKLYRKTGDEDYKQAAEALQIPLIDHIKQVELYSVRRRGQTVGKEVRPRLYRMHRMIAGVATVHAAARQEVASHGRRGHASEDAAIDYLRSKYAEHGEDIAATLAEAERCTKTYRQFEQSIRQLNRVVRASLAPAWAMNLYQPHQRLDALVRIMRRPLLELEKYSPRKWTRKDPMT